ncbi:hypothetical protein H310_11972 [Aphanomyces invadans]|uniref:Elicitin n=1 Tax=Aphanomyces invadans TaxID=157072 RepID=A0A024TJZ4_9STRA|nr:hypothetical protein H310_11972 [Aphanomyces invadans]ETV94324.1 hypothetical protein H310_11972 [Aphanomyces invadans]|eukprot:XP_008877086.1 hypothetical protein H310_11972 [Aphanomyces invadans]
MKCLAVASAIATTLIAAQDVECDVGAIAKAFGPIVGDLNECMTASGYQFLPTPLARPTQQQLTLFCSVPECDKAATSYAGIAKTLPACQFVLDNQAVPTTAFFSTLCPNYGGRTGRPATTTTMAPTTTSSQTTTAAPALVQTSTSTLVQASMAALVAVATMML